MNAYEVIMKKRDGKELSPEQIEFMINAYTAGKIPDYQMAAFLMAIFIRGMSWGEVTALTQAMLNSGDRIDLSSIGRVTVDKHSTGGVGDKVSLILAPLVASCGVPVPMMSGRGLGHTGGTLDKLESIPGFRTDLSEDRFVELVKKIGVAMIGQTKRLAPADKKMYALRDVTATVESIPLIAGSIMSKKLAAGPQAMVFDVKTGMGAFMSSLKQAEEMAQALVQIAIRSGRQAAALITDMNQPLGNYAGNALEIKETIACLQGKGPADLMTVTMEFAGWMLMMGGQAKAVAEGKKVAQAALDSGKAWEKFKEMVKVQGGDVAFVEHPERLARAAREIPIYAETAGYVHQIHAFEMGMGCVALGAGRETTEAKIDYGAGMVFARKVGDAVKKGDLLLTLYTDKKDVIAVEERCRKAILVKKEPAQPYPIIYKVIDKKGVRDYAGK